MDSALVCTGLHSPHHPQSQERVFSVLPSSSSSTSRSFFKWGPCKSHIQSRNAFHNLGFKFEAVVRIADTVRVRWLLALYRRKSNLTWWRFRYLVAPLTPCGPPLSGCLLAWTLVLGPLFLLHSLAWVFSFHKVWQGFIT